MSVNKELRRLSARNEALNKRVEELETENARIKAVAERRGWLFTLTGGQNLTDRMETKGGEGDV